MTSRTVAAGDRYREDGSRVISKTDGTEVTIFPSGDVLIKKPGAGKVVHRKDGKILIEAEGEWREVVLKRKIPLRETPLNVVSVSGEEIGRLMSNFAATPFVLDGKRYASVEAFYVCLKFPGDAKTHAEIRRMDGREAKRFGSKGTETTTTYEGRTFDFGSAEHYALIKRAIRAKLEHHPEIAKAFAATHPRPIVHDTGRPDRPGAVFPAGVFCRILEELRAELITCSA